MAKSEGRKIKPVASKKITETPAKVTLVLNTPFAVHIHEMLKKATADVIPLIINDHQDMLRQIKAQIPQRAE